MTHVYALAAGLQLVVLLPDGGRLTLAGEAAVQDGHVEVRRVGGRGGAIFEEVSTALRAQGWEAVSGLPAPGARVGASRNALAVRWRHEDLWLLMQLYDTGYGGEAVLQLGAWQGLEEPARVPFSFELVLPSGAALPVDAAALRVHGPKACLDGAGSGEPGPLVSALHARGWKDTRDGWLRRRGVRLLPDPHGDEICLVVDVPLSPGWEALGLPRDQAILEEESFERLNAHVAAGQGDAWVEAADAALRARGWMPSPEADHPTQPGGAQNYERDGAWLSVRSDVNDLVQLRRGRPPVPPSLSTLLLPLDVEDALRLSGLDRVEGTPGSLRLHRAEWTPLDIEDPLLTGVLSQLDALGWTYRVVARNGSVTASKGDHSLVLALSSDYDPRREKSTRTLILGVRVPLPAPLSPSVFAPLPDGRASGQIQESWLQLHPSLVFPGEVVLPVLAEGLRVEEGAICATVEEPGEARARWDAAFTAGGWVPYAGVWLERGADRVRILEEDGRLCVWTSVPTAPQWAALGLPLGNAMIIGANERLYAVAFEGPDAMAAARERALAQLRAQGWSEGDAPRDWEDQGVKAHIDTVARGDEELVLAFMQGPQGPLLEITRSGPPIAW